MWLDVYPSERQLQRHIAGASEAEMDATLGYEKIVKVILRAIIRGMATLPKHSKASTGNSRSMFPVTAMVSLNQS